MNAFDFLAAPPGIIPTSLQIDRRFFTPLLVIATAIVTLVLLYAFDAYRLEMERESSERFEHRLIFEEESVTRMRALRGSLDRAVRLEHGVALARDSGAQEALRVTRIGNVIPERVWLTLFDDSGSDIRIEGRARSFDRLAGMLAALEFRRAPLTLHLIAAELPDGSHDGNLRYELTLGEGAR